MSLHIAIIAAISIFGSAQSSIVGLSQLDNVSGGSRCSSWPKPATNRWQAERRTVIRHRPTPNVQILSFGP